MAEQSAQEYISVLGQKGFGVLCTAQSSVHNTPISPQPGCGLETRPQSDIHPQRIAILGLLL